MKQQRVLLVLVAFLSLTAFSCASTGSQDTAQVTTNDEMTSMTSSSSSSTVSGTAAVDHQADLSTTETIPTAGPGLAANYPATDMTPGVIDGTPSNNVYSVTGPALTASSSSSAGSYGTSRANNLNSSTSSTLPGSMTSSSSIAPDTNTTDDTDDTTTGTAGTRRRMSKD